jgi:hypothetical protein
MPIPSLGPRPRLRDIVRGDAADFQRAWDTTEASSGFDPLPSGVYRCLVVAGQLFTSKANATPGFKVEFQVIAGPFAERKIWHDIWLTSKALSMAKGELAKLGITNPGQLEQPVPPGLIADVTVVQRSGDDGTTFNRVKTFKIIDADVPADDYRPADVEPSEVDTRPPLAGQLDAHGFNYETNRYESARPLLEDAASRVPTTPSTSREPGEDDDLDDGGFNRRHGVQYTPSAPLLDPNAHEPKGRAQR